MRRLFAVPVIIAMLASGAVVASPCKDAKGKFTKCPPVKAAAVRCKAADGKFAKCGTKGAKPM